MTTKRSNLRDKFDRAQALLLALLMVASVITPLYVGTTSADAAPDLNVGANGHFWYTLPRTTAGMSDYFINTENLDEDVRETFNNLVNSKDPTSNQKVGVRFIDSTTGAVQWTADLRSLNDTEINNFGSHGEPVGKANILKYTYGMTSKQKGKGVTTDDNDLSADKMVIRDLTLTPPAKDQPSPKEDVTRIIFKSTNTSSLEYPTSVRFVTPYIKFVDTDGNAVSVTAYNSTGGSSSVSETKLLPYGDETESDCTPGPNHKDWNHDYWYIDVDTTSIANANSVIFTSSEYMEEEDVNKGKDRTDTREQMISAGLIKVGNVSTSSLPLTIYSDHAFYDGAIPRDPHIYTFSASAFLTAPQLKTFNSKGFQNYLVFNDDETITASKYHFPERCKDAITRKVWVYNELWKDANKDGTGTAKIYATGDQNDMLQCVTPFEQDKTMPDGWFSGELVVGAEYVFHINENDETLGASETVSIPLAKDKDGNPATTVEEASGYNYTPLYDTGKAQSGTTSNENTANTAYYMSNNYQDQWVAKDKANKKDYDYKTTSHYNPTSQNLYWVDATYYDYLSENEIAKTEGATWRNTKYHEEKSSTDNGFGNYNSYAATMFTTLNNAIYNTAKTTANKNWRYPLYFGNFYGDSGLTGDKATDSSQPVSKLMDYYIPRTNTTAKRFWAANNSNGLTDKNGWGGNHSQSVMGLLYPELTKNFYGSQTGAFDYNVYVGNDGATHAPYFDYEWLKGSGILKAPSTTTTTGPEYIEHVENIETGNVGTYSKQAKIYTIKISPYFDKILISKAGDDGKRTELNVKDVLNKYIGHYSNGTFYVSEDKNFHSVLGEDDYYYIKFADEDQLGEGSWNAYVWNSSSEDTPKGFPGMSLKSGATETFQIKTTTTKTYDDSRKAYVVQSEFPFRTEKDSSGITHYKFNSAKNGNAYSGDIVNFNYSGNEPTRVNYYYNNDTQKVRNMDLTNYKQYGSETGFFPFNNGEGKTDGEIAHDFGFATKMEMEFKLPANGKFSESNHAEFNFTGDDDLWVYIDGQLALDLGGAHKQTSGRIDFGYATNKIQGITDHAGAVLNDVTDYENSYRLYEFIIDPQKFSMPDGKTFDASTKFTFSNNGSSVGGDGSIEYSSEYTFNDASGKVFHVKDSDISSNKFTTGSVRDTITSTDYSSKLSGGKYYIYAYGKETSGWTDCVMNIEGVSESVSPNVSIIKPTSDNSGYDPTTDEENINPGNSGNEDRRTLTPLNINNTDTSQVHTMTIYYMERGMGESNMSIDFTTLPANTEVQVNKTVDEGNINEGFDVTSEPSDTITRRDSLAFRMTDNPNANDITTDTALQGTKYSLYDNADKTTTTKTIGNGMESGNENVLALKHDQTATFSNSFNVGDYVTTGEKGDGEDSLSGAANNSNYYNYTTYFRLYDAAGNLKTIGNGISQAGGVSGTNGAKLVSDITPKTKLEEEIQNGGYYKFTQNDSSAHRSASFQIQDDNNDPAAFVTRQIDYLNRIDTTDLVISTEIVDPKDGYKKVNKNRSRFTYTLEVYDGFGNNNPDDKDSGWSRYPFEAEIFLYDTEGKHVLKEGVTEDKAENYESYDTKLQNGNEYGVFSLSKYDKIVIHGLPTNLPYRIVENREQQFAGHGYIVNNDIDGLIKANDGTAPAKEDLDKYLVEFSNNNDDNAKSYATSTATDSKKFDYNKAQNSDTGTLLCKSANGEFVLNKSQGIGNTDDAEVESPEQALTPISGTVGTPEALTTAKKANSIQIINVYSPVPGALQAKKTVNNADLPSDISNENKFTFKAELEAVWDYENDATHGKVVTRPSDNATDFERTYSYAKFNNAGTDQTGLVNFTGATFGPENAQCSYLYKITEVIPDGNNDYIWDESVYYAVIYINAGGTMEKPVYYKSNPDVTSFDDATWRADSAATWSCCGDPLESYPTFNNDEPTQSADVTFKKVQKRGEDTTPLKDAEFTLYTDESCTIKGVKGTEGENQKVVSSKADSTFDNPVTSVANGLVTFKDLDYTPHADNTLKTGDKVTFDVVLTKIDADAKVGSIQGTLKFDTTHLTLTSGAISKALSDKFSTADINFTDLSTANSDGKVQYSITLGDDNAITANDITGNNLVIASFEFEAKANGEASAYAVQNRDIAQGTDGAVIEVVGAAGTTIDEVKKAGSAGNITSKVEGSADSRISTYANPTRAYTVYYLKETKAPTGFTKLDGTFRLLIDSSGNSKLEYKGTGDGADWGTPSTVIGVDADEPNRQTVINPYTEKPASFTVEVKKKVQLESGNGEDILSRLDSKPTFKFNAELWTLNAESANGVGSDGAKTATVTEGEPDGGNDNSLVELFKLTSETAYATDPNYTVSFQSNNIDINDITVTTLVYKITEDPVEGYEPNTTPLYAFVKLEKENDPPFTVTYSTDPTGDDATGDKNTVVNTLKKKEAGFEILGTKMVTNSESVQVVPPKSFEFSAELEGALITDIYGNSYTYPSTEEPPSTDEFLDKFVNEFKFNDTASNKINSSRFKFTKNGIDMTEIATAELKYTVQETSESDDYTVDNSAYVVTVSYDVVNGFYVSTVMKGTKAANPEPLIAPIIQISGEETYNDYNKKLDNDEKTGVKFVNKYKSADKSFELTASKTIKSDYSSGGKPTDGQFSFTATLTRVSYKDKEENQTVNNGAVTDDNFSTSYKMFGFVQDVDTRTISSKKSNGADGTITFDPVQYDTNRYTEVELTYKIEEDVLTGENANLFKPQTTYYTVTVKPSADGEGFDITYTEATVSGIALAAEAASLLAKPLALAAYDAGIMPIATIDGSAAFENPYKDVTPSLSLTALKHVTTSADPTAEEGSAPGTELNGAFSFTATLKSVTITDLVNNKTYAYDGSRWTVDGTPEGGSNTVPANIKNLFLFNGENASDPTGTGVYSQTATNTGDTVTFNMLNDTPNIGGLKVEGLTYTIVEEDIPSGAAKGVYNKDGHTWTVEVTPPDAGAAEPSPKFTYKNTGSGGAYEPKGGLGTYNAAFLNKYQTDDTNVQFSVNKVIQDSNGNALDSTKLNALLGNPGFTFKAELYKLDATKDGASISYDASTGGGTPIPENLKPFCFGGSENPSYSTTGKTSNSNPTVSFSGPSIDTNAYSEIKTLIYKITETGLNSSFTDETKAIYVKISSDSVDSDTKTFIPTYWSDEACTTQKIEFDGKTAPDYINKLKSVNGSYKIDGTKTVSDGRNPMPVFEFDAKLTSASVTTIYSDTPITDTNDAIVQALALKVLKAHNNTSTGQFSFSIDELDLTEIESVTLVYQITENKDVNDNGRYTTDPTVYTVTLTYNKSEVTNWESSPVTGTFTQTITAEKNGEQVENPTAITFTNTYKPNPQSVSFAAKKYVQTDTSGAPALAEEKHNNLFKFTAKLDSIVVDTTTYTENGDHKFADDTNVNALYEAAKLGESNSSTGTLNNGNIAFANLPSIDLNKFNFDKLVYSITEEIPTTSKGWAQSTTSLYAETYYAVVTKNGDTLKTYYYYNSGGTEPVNYTTVGGDGTITPRFLNIYTASPGSVELKAEKYYKIDTGTPAILNSSVSSPKISNINTLLNAFKFSANIVSITKDGGEAVTSGFTESAVNDIYDAFNITNTATNGNDGNINFEKKDINDLNAFDFNTQIEIIYELSEDGWQDGKTQIPGWSTDTTKYYAKVTISHDSAGNKNMLGEVKYYDASVYNAATGILTGDGDTNLKHFTNTYTAKNANIAFEVAKTLDGAQVPDDLITPPAFTFTANLYNLQLGGTAVFGSGGKMVTPTPTDFTTGSPLYKLTGVMSNADGRTNVKFTAPAGASIDANNYNGYTFVYTITEDDLADTYTSQYTKDNSTVYAVVKINSATEPYYSVEYYSEVTVTTANPSQPGTLQLVSKNKISDPPFTFKNTTLITTDYAEISFVKIDAATGDPLSGATFTLYTDEECESAATTNDVCPGDATCTFENDQISATGTGLVTFKHISYQPESGTPKEIPGRTFYFKETKAAAGHELNPNTYKAVILTNGKYNLYVKTPNDTEFNQLPTPDDGDKFQIANNPSTHLPLAGGSGVAMFYIFGLAAVLIAAGGYGIYRKRLNLRAGAWEEIPPEK